MGHGSVADEIKGRRDGAQEHGPRDLRGRRALPVLHRRLGALHGPRDLDGGPGEARLRRRARLRRVHAVPRRPRLHAALDGAHPPLARPLHRLARASTRRPASCSTGSSRAASTRTCARESTAYVAAAGVDGVAIGGSLGQDKEQMHEVVGWALRRAARRAAAPPARDRRRRRHPARRRRRHRHASTAPRPTRLARHGTALVPDPGAPLAARPDQGRVAPAATSRSPRAAPARPAATTPAATCTTSPATRS